MALSAIQFFYSLWMCISRMSKSFRSIEFSYSIRRTSFFNHILSVIFSCSKPKVIWIHALRNIALMADKKATWDFPKEVFPYPSRNNYPLSGFVSSRADPHSSIHVSSGAFNLAAFKPNPTATRSFYITSVEA